MIRILRWSILPVLIVLVSCERAIEFTPDNPSALLVVEATIEDGRAPLVQLTRSLNFFSTISPEELTSSFVRNATVRISDGTRIHQLREYEQEVAAGISLFYYSNDSASQSTSFVGETGKAYSLIISVDGEEYAASTTIPVLEKTIDSLYFEENVDDKDSSKVILYGRFQDPAGLGNYSRYFTSANEGRFFAGFNSIFDDQIIDGKSYAVQIEQGVDRNTDIDFEEYAFFRRGDSITVKYCNIDKAVFDFWRTMEFSYSSIGNPFSSPTKVTGNISNGALGYFGGYAVQYAGIRIPE